MLVLSRRLNEKIVLPELGITVQVLAVKKGAIRLGIEAPPDISVCREEVLRRSQARTGQPGEEELCAA
jgi:carbon storage regulator CsrA